MEIERCIGHFRGADGTELILIRDSRDNVVPYVNVHGVFMDYTRGLPHPEQETFRTRVSAWRVLAEYREAFV